MTEHWTWLGGWGIEPQVALKWLSNRWPKAVHTWIYPGPGWANTLAEAPLASRLFGYSLGAHLLWHHHQGLAPTLLAPFQAFPAEAGHGGKIQRAQVRYLQKWLRRDPAAALADFYQRAKLQLPRPSSTWLSAHADELHWGLEILAETALPDPAGTAPARTLIGQQDALLETSAMASTLPAVELLPEAGHCLTELGGALQ